jgi:DNA-binding NarL/FixJ family response regulator
VPEPAEPIGVLVVAGAPLLRRGLADALAAAPGLRLVGAAATAAEGAALAAAGAPAVAVVGAAPPDAPDPAATIAALRRGCPGLAAVVVGAAPLGADELAARVRRAAGQGSRAAGGAPPGALTDRERQLLLHLAAGRTTGQIAAALGVRPQTVKHRVAALRAKLGAADRTQAVLAALRRGLLALDDLAAPPP